MSAEHEPKSLLLQTQALVELARSGAVRESLEAAFQQITRTAAETLGVERVSIWLYDEGRTAICCADLYERAERRHTRGGELRAEAYPAYFEALQTERAIAADDARSDPRTREFAATYLDPLGISAMLDAPIRAGGRMIGVVCHEHVGSPRAWSDDEQRFAGSIADAVSLAFEENERRRILAREQAARAEAEAANRTKDEFLATVSHELRTPLNAMLGWVHLLRSGSLDATMTERALETIERNIQAQAQIIDDILDVSRIIRGSLMLSVGAVDLATLLHHVVDSLGPAAQAKGIALHTVLEAADSRLAGDPDRLQQVVWNLLSNAIKFTARGGEVTLRLTRWEDGLRLEVADTGEGIAPEFLPHVFERFRQANGSTTRVHGGLGLGLAIVRHLVELHGGTVEAESAGEGRGSRFIVTLPAAPPGAVSVRSVTEAPHLGGLSQPLAGLRLLLVDDDLDTCEAISVLLSRAGARVATASSVPEALAQLARSRPDILITDIGMPERDGYDLLRQVRARSREEGGGVPAVAMTAYALPEDRERALAAGFQEHIPKPADPAQLVAGLARLAGRPA